ncbi:Uncharacterised protein [Legionella hackeliae]|uniref:Uncharacterized protein n=1 Tax=Legionella hackeliae TaxID=449 RepID=A0A0A8UN10_LEGHA|nr:hypothetical protein Lhac_2960 [Legionella hackeliae]CEK10098.1 membrane protein of unknown function [Legionella hackeliae]STX46823.1 Uncharacterised protein [Legionella hackeliae]
MNIIFSVLFCKNSVGAIKNSGLILLLQIILLLELVLSLMQYQPQLVNKALFFVVLLCLFNLILVFYSKAHYFFAYNNAFFIGLWLLAAIFAIEQLLLVLVSPYFISARLIYMWALYFLFYSLLSYFWGIMMFINILNAFISKPLRQSS